MTILSSMISRLEWCLTVMCNEVDTCKFRPSLEVQGHILKWLCTVSVVTEL